ncbi:hypothetical protein KGP36_02815 [Patescibacteria group bacterium]|nr:hypothetical protein [Patescibacteria group bacterium]
MKKRIVAEITRNWMRCKPDPTEKPLISQEFERVISVNAERGYVLESWQLIQFVYDYSLTETIVAVFVEA